MKVNIQCVRPKYLKGEYEFDRLEDVAKWLCRMKGLSKDAVGKWLYGLMKNGCAGGHTTRRSIEIESTFHDYSIAREIAFNVGLLKGGIGGDRYSNNRALALEFAREVDKLTLEGSS